MPASRPQPGVESSGCAAPCSASQRSTYIPLPPPLLLPCIGRTCALTRASRLRGSVPGTAWQAGTPVPTPGVSCPRAPTQKPRWCRWSRKEHATGLARPHCTCHENRGRAQGVVVGLLLTCRRRLRHADQTRALQQGRRSRETPTPSIGQGKKHGIPSNTHVQHTQTAPADGVKQRVQGLANRQAWAAPQAKQAVHRDGRRQPLADILPGVAWMGSGVRREDWAGPALPSVARPGFRNGASGERTVRGGTASPQPCSWPSNRTRQSSAFPSPAPSG